jgi:hypothetical protein
MFYQIELELMSMLWCLREVRYQEVAILYSYSQNIHVVYYNQSSSLVDHIIWKMNIKWKNDLIEAIKDLEKNNIQLYQKCTPKNRKIKKKNIGKKQFC